MFLAKAEGYLRLRWFILALSFTFLCQQCWAMSVKLKLEVSLDKNEYKAEDPINITFNLENKGKEPIYVNKRFYLGAEGMPKGERDIFLIVTSPSGAKLPCKFNYEIGYPKSDYFELLEPAKAVSSEYPRNLKGYFDISEPGTYKVVAVYENVYGPEIGLDAFRKKIESDPVTFKIVKPETANAKSQTR